MRKASCLIVYARPVFTSTMTPVIVILFVLALCTSYVYIAMNASTLTYVGDYKFVMFKTMIVVSIIAMGYLSTWFSVCYANLPIIGPKVARGLQALFENPQYDEEDVPTNTVMRTFLEYLSGVWFILAVALLPFGHTVFETGTQNIDVDRTNQLKMMYQAVYAGPYYFMTLVFSVHLFLVFFALANGNHRLQGAEVSDNGIEGAFSALTKFSGEITPTCGWFFYIQNYKVEGGEES